MGSAKLEICCKVRDFLQGRDLVEGQDMAMGSGDLRHVRDLDCEFGDLLPLKK